MDIEEHNAVTDFVEELNHAGLSPRDVSPHIGLHVSSLYRISTGRSVVNLHTTATLTMATKWLRWFRSHDILADSPNPRARAEQIALAFDTWLREV